MSPSMHGTVAERDCPFCGRSVPSRLNSCPYCREAMPTVQLSSGHFSLEGRRKIRRGLLYMLLAGVIYYFTGDASPWKSPIPIPAFVHLYLAPLLFLGGAGMTLFGLYLKIKS